MLGVMGEFRKKRDGLCASLSPLPFGSNPLTMSTVLVQTLRLYPDSVLGNAIVIG